MFPLSSPSFSFSFPCLFLNFYRRPFLKNFLANLLFLSSEIYYYSHGNFRYSYATHCRFLNGDLLERPMETCQLVLSMSHVLSSQSPFYYSSTLEALTTCENRHHKVSIAFMVSPTTIFPIPLRLHLESHSLPYL